MQVFRCEIRSEMCLMRFPVRANITLILWQTLTDLIELVKVRFGISGLPKLYIPLKAIAPFQLYLHHSRMWRQRQEFHQSYDRHTDWLLSLEPVRQAANTECASSGTCHKASTMRL
jgi:hypothetical protein